MKVFFAPLRETGGKEKKRREGSGLRDSLEASHHNKSAPCLPAQEWDGSGEGGSRPRFPF